MKKIIVLFSAVCLLFASSCTPKKKPVTQEINPPTPQKQVVEDTTMDITLYYADKDAASLCAETRTVPSDKANDASFVISELLKGTSQDNLTNSIPMGTRVNSCTVENGLCTLDLSAEFISKQGTANEKMAIYSVVNTLCCLDGVDEVQFLIDGQKVKIFGSYIFDEPFSPEQ